MAVPPIPGLGEAIAKQRAARKRRPPHVNRDQAIPVKGPTKALPNGAVPYGYDKYGRPQFSGKPSKDKNKKVYGNPYAHVRA